VGYWKHAPIQGRYILIYPNLTLIIPSLCRVFEPSHVKGLVSLGGLAKSIVTMCNKSYALIHQLLANFLKYIHTFIGCSRCVKY
jgi:hypothetical protein